MAVDPLDHNKCLGAAKDNGWEITQVLNTHEHGDHTGGNAKVIAATGAKLLAHHEAGDIFDLDESSVVGPSLGVVRGETEIAGRVTRVLDLAVLGASE